MIKLTKRQRDFCNNYAKFGGNYALIAKEMKISIGGVLNYTQQDAVKEYLSCSMQRAKDSMIAALPHITEELLRMYNNTETDDKVKIEIAKQFLDRAGLVADKNVNFNVNINTQISDRARKILSERQNQTIETTATPVNKPFPDVLPNVSSIEIPSDDRPTTDTN